MSHPSIATPLKFANLQMAAEAILPAGYSGPDALELTDGNNRASRFTPTLANRFIADGWAVLAHRDNTGTGFSGTLFKYDGQSDPTRGLVNGELALSFRSTEFIDDAVRDAEATSDLEIKTGGFAIGQIADMENWFKVLNADPTMLQGKNFAVIGYSRRTKAPEASLLKTKTLLGRVASDGCRRPA